MQNAPTLCSKCSFYVSKKYGRDDVGKYTFYILEKMYADPPVIEHFGTKTKQGRERKEERQIYTSINGDEARGKER